MGRKIALKQKATLHNKFHLILTDCRTGKVKQEAMAYNIVLKSGINRWLDHFGVHSEENRGGQWSGNFMRMLSFAENRPHMRFGGRIHIGTGSGTLDPERTSLFSPLGFHDTQYFNRGINSEDLTAYYTQFAQSTAGQWLGNTITEVGLAPRAGDLSTHALIEDSEGNPINIVFGEFDILTIYSTVYISLSDHSENVKFVGGDDNVLLAMVGNNAGVRNRTSSNTFAPVIGPNSYFTFGTNDGPVERSDSHCNTLLYTSDNRMDTWERDYNENKLTVSFRIEAPNANSMLGIREIGFRTDILAAEFGGTGERSLFRSILPIPGVWDGYTSEEEEIGLGDGVTDSFNFKWDKWLENSEVIKINGVSKTRGVDYEAQTEVGQLEPENNLAPLSTLSVHSGVNASYPASRAVDENISTFCIINESISGGIYNNPPWLVFDTGTQNYINKLRIYQGTTGSYSIKDFKFQGSNDGGNWTDIIVKTLQNSIGWYDFFFKPSNYRYYKLLIMTTHGTYSSVYIYEAEFGFAEPHIKFNNPPAIGDAITADYSIDYIPKDENHVLDVSFTLQFADGNA